MGKTMTKEQRKKSNKYCSRDAARQRKLEANFENPTPKKPAPKQKWKPHSETNIDY